MGPRTGPRDPEARSIVRRGGEHLSVPFLSIQFNLEALRKLAERGLSVDEVAELFRAARVVWIDNPNPRADDSRWVIGPTAGGRFVTVVVDRDPENHGEWQVMTAWDSTPAQIAIYRRAL
jgi:uncharacterized DUF497 family protein